MQIQSDQYSTVQWKKRMKVIHIISESLIRRIRHAEDLSLLTLYLYLLLTEDSLRLRVIG